MRPLRSLLAGLAALTLLTACAGDADPGSSPQPSLSDTSWTLTDVVIDNTSTAAVDAAASLNFAADGSLYGSTGCNRFMGNWTSEGGDLSIQTGGLTQMACQGPLEAQESAVLAAFEATTSYTIVDESLTLTGDDGAELATYRQVATDLAGTSWTATGVNNGKDAVESTALTPELTLLFGTDGSATGFAGCTNFTGMFTTSGPAVAITDLAADAECGDAALAPQQEQYLKALAAATNYGIDGNRLDLRDEGGALQAGFTAQP